MKNKIKLNCLFISMLMLGCSLGFRLAVMTTKQLDTSVEVTTDQLYRKNVLSD